MYPAYTGTHLSAVMQSGVACGAKSDQILFAIVSGLAAEFFVMDFKIRPSATRLASPAIPP